MFRHIADAQGVWYVNPERERQQNTVRAAMTSSQEAFLVVGGGATAGNMYRMGTDPVKRRLSPGRSWSTRMPAVSTASTSIGRRTGRRNRSWHVPEDDMVDLLQQIRARMAELPVGTKSGS